MKERLDVLLVKKGLAKSREIAKSYIKAGKVYVNGRCESKASTPVKEDEKLEIIGETLKYVSRGGLKLEKAIQAFSLSIEDKTCMDIGASTGGFTDCMLSFGARKVYAIDVGTNQLDAKLLQDERVVSLEKTNVRNLTKDKIAEKIDFVSVDVSFISLTKVIPVFSSLFESGTRAVCLIKPQFEAGREHLNKKGVIKDKKVQSEIIYEIIEFITKLEYTPLGLSYSPIKGPEGNIEFLLYFELRKQKVENRVFSMNVIREVVEQAHHEFL